MFCSDIYRFVTRSRIYVRVRTRHKMTEAEPLQN